jgi:hypothetical protein
MIKLISLMIILFASPVEEKPDTCTIPAYWQEYIHESKGNTKEPDTTDIFVVVHIETSYKEYYKPHGVVPKDGIYRILLPDSIEYGYLTPSVFYHMVKGGVDGTFFHLNMKGSSRSFREVRVLPRVFLSKVKVIDLKQRWAEMKDSKELRRFLDDEFKGKVWVIDKAFITEDSVVLIEMDSGYTF